jgi:hypothetical protein
MPNTRANNSSKARVILIDFRKKRKKRKKERKKERKKNSRFDQVIMVLEQSYILKFVAIIIACSLDH